MLLVVTGLLVGIFYSLDALDIERRDRSILFWKSLPVSELTTVLSKASIPLRAAATERSANPNRLAPSARPEFEAGVALRDGRERSTMEGAGQGGGRLAIAARHARLIQSLAKEVKSMSTDLMMKRIAEASPRLKARIAGALSLLSLLAVVFGEFFVRRLEFAGDLIAVSGMVAVTLLLYDIFKPVNRASLCSRRPSTSWLTVGALRWNPRGVDITVVFGGFSCLLIGYLIFRSTFLPRILGALMFGTRSAPSETPVRVGAERRPPDKG